MPESELWITRIFNDYLPGVGNAALNLVGKHSVARPWADFVVMQIVVVLLLMVLAMKIDYQRAVKWQAELKPDMRFGVAPLPTAARRRSAPRFR